MNGPNIANLVNKVERIVTGTTHPYLGVIPTKGTIPLAETLTGTITTDNAGTSEGVIVLGTDTIFLTELAPGDFLYDDDAAIRKIRYIFSDTMLELEEKFPASVSGVALKRPKNQYYKEILATSSGTADAELMEANFPDTSKYVGYGSPLSYDASAGSAQITFDCVK
jgi:hypothetical protein